MCTMKISKFKIKKDQLEELIQVIKVIEIMMKIKAITIPEK